MATTIQGAQAVETAGNIAAIVANAIVPNSGAVAKKVVDAGGKIILAVIDFFNRKKKEGKTDAQVLSDPEFKAMAAAKAVQDQLVMELTAQADSIQVLASQQSEDDRLLNTQLKSLKISKGLTGKAALDYAMANPTFNPNGLKVFYELRQALSMVGNTGGTGGTSMPTGGTNTQEPKSYGTGGTSSQEQQVKPMSELFIGGAAAFLLGWYAYSSGGLDFFMKMLGMKAPTQGKTSKQKAAAKARAAKKAKAQAENNSKTTTKKK